jgi:hypothetical protein
LASGQSDVRALFYEQVSDSRIRPTGCLFVYYFFELPYETYSKQPDCIGSARPQKSPAQASGALDAASV